MLLGNANANAMQYNTNMVSERGILIGRDEISEDATSYVFFFLLGYMYM